MKTLFILIPFCALFTIISTGEDIKPEIGIKDISKPDSDLSVAHGNLVSHNVQENPRLLSYAVYDLSTIARGPLKGNRVTVHFYASTLHPPLPEDAILILQTLFYNDIQDTRTYRAIGLEAWRGIIPYSKEQWEAICKMPSPVLSRSSMEDRLPLDRAIQIARQEADHHYENEGVSIQRMQLDDKALRNNFSWVISFTIDTPDSKRSGIYWRSIDLVEITDTGVLLDYQPGRHATEVYEDGTYTDEKTALFDRYIIEPKQAKGLTAHKVICKKDTFYIPEINLEDTYDAVSEWGFMEEDVSPMARNCPYIQWVRSLDPEKDFVLFIDNPDGQESPWKYLDAATARNGIRIGYSLRKTGPVSTPESQEQDQGQTRD